MNNCIFCHIVSGEEQSWLVHETDSTLAFLDTSPMNPYHTLVIPKQHYSDIFELPTAALKEIMCTVKHVIDMYQKKLDINDVQIISSNGIHAQQDVQHIHFHIAPRHANDNQELTWDTQPELVKQFDNMLHKLRSPNIE